MQPDNPGVDTEWFYRPRQIDWGYDMKRFLFQMIDGFGLGLGICGAASLFYVVYWKMVLMFVLGL